jgi:hypothetical protein
MVERFLQVCTGASVGFIFAALCIISGLQVKAKPLLFTICIGTGITSALATGQVTKAIGKDKRAIAPQEIDKAIGAISERYALSHDRQQILVALQELKGELHND